MYGRRVDLDKVDSDEKNCQTRYIEPLFLTADQAIDL